MLQQKLSVVTLVKEKYSVPAFVNETNFRDYIHENNSWSHSLTGSIAVVIFVNKDCTRSHSKVRNTFIPMF